MQKLKLDEIALDLKATVALTRQVMEGAVNLSVPLQVETGTGPNWMEAK